MINVFPAKEQALIRTILSTSLLGVISQQLVRTADGRGRLAAIEVMLNTPAASNMIREGKTEQLTNVIQGGGLMGMQSMDTALRRLLDAKQITGTEAYMKASNKEDFAQYCEDPLE